MHDQKNSILQVKYELAGEWEKPSTIRQKKRQKRKKKKKKKEISNIWMINLKHTFFFAETNTYSMQTYSE